MIPEVATQFSQGWKQPIVLPNYVIYEPQKLAQHNNPKRVTWHPPLAVITSSLTRLKTSSTREKSCLVLQS